MPIIPPSCSEAANLEGGGVTEEVPVEVERGRVHQHTNISLLEDTVNVLSIGVKVRRQDQ